jgi:hypothetical protein
MWGPVYTGIGQTRIVKYGGKSMGRLRSTMLFGLIAYFGGFATAIYYLAPASKDAADKTGRKTVQTSTWKESGKTQMDREKLQEMAGQFGQRMREVVSLAEEKVQQAVALYKAQTAAKQDGKEG